MSTTRVLSTTVTFRCPFILDGFDQVRPAGPYVVDTEEEAVGTFLSTGWKRVSTAIRLNRHGAVEYMPVDPEQLHEALMRDGAQPDPASAPSSSSPSPRRHRARDMLAQLSGRRRD